MGNVTSGRMHTHVEDKTILKNSTIQQSFMCKNRSQNSSQMHQVYALVLQNLAVISVHA